MPSTTRSTDATGTILDELASRNPRLRIIHNTQAPPPGWTGKCSVLHHAVPQATGDWLLLVDSDVILQPSVLRRTLTFAAGRNHGMLSLALGLRSGTFWERLLMPLTCGSIVGMYAIALANHDHKKNAFANGQYILIRRDVHTAIGGHEAVKGFLSEDVALARLVKSAGFRPRIAWGMDLAEVRMYSGLSNLVRGWARNFYGIGLGRPWRILAATAFLLQCCFSAYIAIAWGIHRAIAPVNTHGAAAWLAAGGAHLLLMSLFLGTTYRWGGAPRRYALYFPLGGAMLLWVFIRALTLCATGKVQWRGDTYAPSTVSKAPTA